ncbi:MAG: ribosome-associated translation inhibitor RaiA [Candidatus Delongbacteria bacterium]|nr:ribosome-associated translation inhibitor RaiA [Candidatus Delongbacteria bacterium]
MIVNITARHFELTDGIQEYINKELTKLKKYFDNTMNVKVILDMEKYRNICEINIKVAGQELNAGDETNDMYSSINNTIEKMERSIKKLKEQLRDHKPYDVTK